MSGITMDLKITSADRIYPATASYVENNKSTKQLKIKLSKYAGCLISVDKAETSKPIDSEIAASMFNEIKEMIDQKICRVCICCWVIIGDFFEFREDRKLKPDEATDLCHRCQNMKRLQIKKESEKK